MAEIKSVLLLLRRLDCNDGVSSYCETLMRSLTELGCEVHVACGTVFHAPETVGRYDRMRLLAKTWTDIGEAGTIPNARAVLTVAAVIRRNRIPVVSLQGFGALLWGRLLSVLTGCGTVATHHLPSAGEAPFDWRQRLFMRLFAPDRIIAVSSKTRDYVVDQFPSLDDRTETICGSIDTAHFRVPTAEERAQARADLGIHHNTLMCLSIGRLDWPKGHDLLISAIQSVRETIGRPIHAFIVGSGNDEPEIRAAASKAEDDCRTITLLGHRDDVRQVIWAADLFVLASRTEGFALVVVEAMACGVVPVRTPSGGASDQIDPGVNGLIVPFDDVPALAAAITSLADDDRRAEMAQLAAERGQIKFDRIAVARQVLATYGKAVARR